MSQATIVEEQNTFEELFRIIPPCLNSVPASKFKMSSEALPALENVPD